MSSSYRTESQQAWPVSSNRRRKPLRSRVRPPARHPTRQPTTFTSGALPILFSASREIPEASGSDTGNASAFNHGRWHGKEAELLVKEVGMPPMEAIVANTSSNAWLMGLEGGSA